MGLLSLLNPLFLFGALGALIPLLLHLIRRERVQIRHFSMFRFLRQSQQAVVRQQRLRRLLLLLLRMAACALLAMIFARPFLENAQSAGLSALQPRAVALLIDTSYSMGYGNRLDMARRHAREILRDLKPGDQATLITFSTQGRILRELTAEHAEFDGLLESGVRLTNQGTNYIEALRAADDQMGRSGFDDQTVYLISDFLKPGWSNTGSGWKMSPGVQLKIIDVRGEGSANVALTDIDIPHPLSQSERTLDLRVRMKNFGDTPFQGSARLFINDEQVASQIVDIPSMSGQVASFRHTFTGENNTGMVVLADDGLALDNRFYFTIGAPAPVRILCVEDRNTAGSQSSAIYYIRNALSLRQDPVVSLDIRSTAELPALALGDYQAVILADVAALSRSANSRLIEYVRSGGGALIAISRDVSPPVFNSSFDGLIPGRMSAIRPDAPRPDQYQTMTDISYQHPVFQPFSGPHNGDFGIVRFFRIARIEVDSTALTLARFDDGTPATLEKKIGQGSALLMTTTLDLGWTDFPIRGVFVPFLYQCVDYLAKAISGRSGGRQYYHLVGEAARLPGGQRMDIETPSGQRRSLVYEPQETPIFTETDEPGFYRVVSEGGDTRFAVNLDTQESDFTPLDVELFVAAMINPVTDSQEMMEMRQETSRLQNSEVERRQRLWWYLAFVLLALVIMETLLASRTHR